MSINGGPWGDDSMRLKVWCIGLWSPATVAVLVVVRSGAFAAVAFVAMVSYVEQYSEALLE